MAGESRTTRRARSLRQLTEQVRAIEARDGGGPGLEGRAAQPIPTGWPPVDNALAIDPHSDPHSDQSPRGLARAAIHECIGLADSDNAYPLAILTHLARQAAAHTPARTPGLIAFIGPRVAPHPWSLATPAQDLLHRCLFIHPPDRAARLWAADAALRSRALAAVIVDADGFDIAATRRLQLAAETARAPAFLARPPSDAGALSAAATRWRIARAPVRAARPRFEITLLRCKGSQRASLPATRTWTVEHAYETGAVHLSPDLLHRPLRAQDRQQQRRRSA